ncbi:probable inactive poly [ADP-ribose] polymerase SRO2 [Tanacetum coccineum]
MASIKKLYQAYSMKRISRPAFIRRLRANAGDDVLLAVVQHMAPLSLETEVKGSILTHSQGQRSISSFGRTGSSFPTSLRLVGVGLSTSQPPPYTVKDGSLRWRLENEGLILGAVGKRRQPCRFRQVQSIESHKYEDEREQYRQTTATDSDRFRHTAADRASDSTEDITTDSDSKFRFKQTEPEKRGKTRRMDTVSIVGDTIKYIQELQENAKELEDELKVLEVKDFMVNGHQVEAKEEVDAKSLKDSLLSSWTSSEVYQKLIKST